MNEQKFLESLRLAHFPPSLSTKRTSPFVAFKFETGDVVLSRDLFALLYEIVEAKTSITDRIFLRKNASVLAHLKSTLGA